MLTGNNKLKMISAALAAIFILLIPSAYAAKQMGAPKLYAQIETSMGTIVCELFPKQAPMTVRNFVGLAQGTLDWMDPRTGEKGVGALYDNVIFHRVIPDFMIQTGDPLGQGTGGPGYKFEDEIDPSLTFDKKGMLAMANSGPATNGSQFFITVAPTPWLTGHHTIFGKVLKGQSIADKISVVPTGSNDRPATPVIIKKIIIKDKQ